MGEENIGGETVNYQELISRDIKELRVLAAKHGIKTGPRSKPETIAKLLIDHIANPPTPKQETMKHPAEIEKAPLKIHTEEEVRAAIARSLEKPGFTVMFPGDDTCTFRCRGAEECIHMSSPLRVIRSKAESVSRGAINPRGLVDNPLNPTKNSGIVLMV